MSLGLHHGLALIEEARSALDTAHRAAVAADAGGLRRGLGGAEALLQEASQAELGEDMQGVVAAVLGDVGKALADLGSGALLEMETLIETARTRLAKA